jgi:large repetitive protein
VTVYLEKPGPDGLPNTGDDVVVNKYITDHWQQPNASQDPQDNGQTPRAPIRSPRAATRSETSTERKSRTSSIQISGRTASRFRSWGSKQKEGAFDGGYAFANYCPNGYNLTTDACNDGSQPDAHPLVAGDYIVHAIMPKDNTDTRACNPGVGESQRVTETHGAVPGGGNGCLYHIVREKDVNVDLGNQFAPQIPPPPCNGDDHLIDKATLTPRSNFFPVAAHTRRCATSTSWCSTTSRTRTPTSS